MDSRIHTATSVVLLAALISSPALAQQTIEAPKVFLDKSPRIVEYQLKRLDNQRLLMVDRQPSDAKYIPVYSAILGRPGMSPQYREEAIAALAKLRDTDTVTEILAVVETLDAGDRQEAQTLNQLSQILLRLPKQDLASKTESLSVVATDGSDAARPVAFAAIILGGQPSAAALLAQSTDLATTDWLGGIRAIPDASVRAAQRDRVIPLIASDRPVDVRRAAVAALSKIDDNQADTFKRVASLFSVPELRTAVVRTLLSVPAKLRDPTICGALAADLVTFAEQTPAKDRTNDSFVDAMQLTDQMIAVVAGPSAKSFRQRLRAVTVRVVRIHTVHEEMRYDIPYFAVEAGRPVQLLLINEDLMPHNLVIAKPGTLKAVAAAGLQAGPTGGMDGKQYVPNSDDVLYATNMVQAEQQERLTFTAPTEPGEYPYVCTFPQHWSRMYGVMVVVDDLDAWLKDPVKPTDPIGSNRSFVQAWTVNDFTADLEQGMRGRTDAIGKRIFEEASCLGCHKVGDEGGAIGPELTSVFTRWKNDTGAVLREVLDPSHRIDDKYAMNLILTVSGQTISGIVVAEDKENVSLLANPEAKEPTLIAQDDIEDMVKTSTSMMPKALMDQYTKDEVFELLGYLQSVDAASK